MLQWRLEWGENGASTVDFPTLTLNEHRVLEVLVAGIPDGATMGDLVLNGYAGGVRKLHAEATITDSGASGTARAVITLRPSDLPLTLPTTLDADAWVILLGGAFDGDQAPCWKGTIRSTVPATPVPDGTISTTISYVTVTPNPVSLGEGQTKQLTATAYNAFGIAIPSATFTYTALDATHDTVNASGLISGILATSGAGAGVRVTATATNTLAVDVPVTVVDAFAQAKLDYDAVLPGSTLDAIFAAGRNQTSAGAGLISRWGDAINNAVAFVPASGFASCSINGAGWITSKGLEIAAAAGYGNIPAAGRGWGICAKISTSNQGAFCVTAAAPGAEFASADAIYLKASDGTVGVTTSGQFRSMPTTGSAYSELVPLPSIPATNTAPIIGSVFVKGDRTRVVVHNHRDAQDCTRPGTAIAGLTTGNKAFRLGVSDGYALDAGNAIAMAYVFTGRQTAAHQKILNDLAVAKFGALQDTRDLLFAVGNSITEQADVTQWINGRANTVAVNHGWSGATMSGTGNALLDRLNDLERQCDFSARSRVVMTCWEGTNEGMTAASVAYYYTLLDDLRALAPNIRLCSFTTPGVSNTLTSGDAYDYNHSVELNHAAHSDQYGDLWHLSPLDDPAQLNVAPYWNGIHPTLTGQQQMYPTYQTAIAAAFAMA